MYDFAGELGQWPQARIAGLIERATVEDVDRAIACERPGENALAALLSPAARSRLEPMAQKAHRLTRRHFGRTIGLYVPLYLSNVCTSDCLYCSFSPRAGLEGKRITLDFDEIRDECEALADHGFQTILLLTGDAPRAAPVNYIAEAVRIAREYFASVSVEVYAMDEPDYRCLCEAGLDGVTLYMETYDRAVYCDVHRAGMKTDYQYRLDAIERAGRAGAWRLNLGALLGLADWRIDGFRLGLHARYIQNTCWKSAVALSFPRLHNVPERFTVPHRVSDVELVQLMLAMRLFLPEAGFTMSTREHPHLRDRLIPLGVTLMSAGSSTRPGGYATYQDVSLEQFAVEDRRPPAEVAQAIRRAGYDPVWKDFDRAFHTDQGLLFPFR